MSTGLWRRVGAVIIKLQWGDERRRERQGDRLDVRLLQSWVGRAYGAVTQPENHAAATRWGRGCWCSSSGGVG